MFTIVSYDTPSDRRRRRLARAIADFVCRVQKSVFEGHVGPDRYRQLLSKIRAVIDTGADSVRVYQLPADTLATVEVFGQPPLNRPSGFCWVGDGEQEDGGPDDRRSSTAGGSTR
jgi:CRISPR-associated protein Cas2